MIFGKKKGMIDVRELQRKGVVKIPEKEIVIPTDKQGFVDFGESSKSTVKKSPVNTSSNVEFFGFDGGDPTSSLSSSSSTSSVDSYEKREVDGKVTNLDNKIYKLEQRIELLERKIGVDGSSEGNDSLIGW